MKTTDQDLKIVRRAYGKQVAAVFGVANKRIEDAFASVRREDFLGPGPWQIFRFRQDYKPTPDDDPVYLYTDDLVGIVPERYVNNGQPSLHAYLLSRAGPQPGEHVVHVGAGTGYYSAIMSHLVGPSGTVTAIEYDADLADLARSNLESLENTKVVQGDGSTASFEPADVIYVNAGATRPAETWLDGLKDGGRLVLPLTTDKSFTKADFSNMHLSGAVFLVTRSGDDLPTQWISPVAIFPCEGVRDAASEQLLATAFESGDCRKVKRLIRSDDLPLDQCWVQAPGWSLTFE